MAARFVRAWTDGTIAPHVAATLVEVGLGFVVGAGLAVLLGYLLARSRLAERLLSPYLVAAQATPILALAPLIALWFGTGLLVEGRHLRAHRLLPGRGRDDGRRPAVDRGLLEMGRCVPRHAAGRSSPAIEIPAALPAIIGGLRVGVTLAVVGAIVGEWAGADQGLGVLINLARGSLFDIPLAVRHPAHDRRPGRRPATRRRPRRAPPRRRPRLKPRTWRSRERVRSAALAVAWPPASSSCVAAAPAARRRRRQLRAASPSTATSADHARRRPRLHPERPVRPVLLRPAGGLLRGGRPERDVPERDRPDLITLVGQGAIDIGVADGTSVIPAVSQGIPVRYVATIYAKFPNVVFAKASSGITTAADLKGRKIGTPGQVRQSAGSCSRRCSSRPA